MENEQAALQNHSFKKDDKNTFQEDVLKGLSATKKYLDSKYFYDAEGDRLFQKIMHCPEYYLTDCEKEILHSRGDALITVCQRYSGDFDVVELGAGDASKSVYLLESLAQKQSGVCYYPIDISPGIIAQLEKELPAKFPAITVTGMAGEYFEMLSRLQFHSSKARLVLFLGSTIGNMPFDSTLSFLKELKRFLNPGDLLLTGFDLVKDPAIILNAYNDRAGYTKAFNLNLLRRINRELEGNFKLNRFEHAPLYNATLNACESYLVSLDAQQVTVADKTFYFQEGERIFMETSRKFSIEDIVSLAQHTGFSSLDNFYDDKKWFADALWLA
jgi:dimethylhistidine N-methyltransferase